MSADSGPKMKIHFMGILGSGVAGVTGLAKDLGYEVTGCDLRVKGHSARHLKDVDLMVVTPAVFFQSPKHPEILEGKKRGILITWQEFLGKYLLRGKRIICVAGTHGKSTTTAMIGKLMEDQGFDPVVVVGAKVSSWRGNYRFGKGEYAVVEADEFNNNFLNYFPEIIVLNDIEFDHPDFFKSEKEVRDSFNKFIGNLTAQKILITEKDSRNIKFNLKIPGVHNQKNANLAFCLGEVLGIKRDAIIKSIEDFSGVGRRMEYLGKTKSGVKIYDDYAHHPTAIAATLEGLREIYPNERVWAIVEAHGFRRTKALINKYKGVFDKADKVVIGPIFRARDTHSFGITEKSIVLASKHKDAKAFDKLTKMFEFLKENLKSDDVVLVMGAGKSNLWAQKIFQI